MTKFCVTDNNEILEVFLLLDKHFSHILQKLGLRSRKFIIV